MQFEPLESFGVAQASILERAPIVLANFDNDTSGPGGEGTIDVIAIRNGKAKGPLEKSRAEALRRGD